jgi:very-short-patch-repair endonuclease
MVVEGMRHRVAVECDGERWHGPERHEEDMIRQRMLERCGWRFWRVRGGSFYLDPDSALDELWETLAREDVYPEGYEPAKERKPGAVESLGARVEESIERPPSTVSSEDEPRVDSITEPEMAADVTRADDRDERRDSWASSGMRDLADAPYVAWSSGARLPDPAEGRPSELIPALVDIVSTEGPMSAHQLYRVFVKGAGRQRVGRRSRRALNKAVWKALRDGRLDQRDEIGQTRLEDRILWQAGAPSVVVRPRGNREFVEIPPSEVATVMLRLERRDQSLREENLSRAVLDFYETKRMTANIEQRLRWVHERRQELAREEGADR